VIFVDTGAWYAPIVPSTECQQQVLDCMRTPELSFNTAAFITIGHIVDELLALLRVRRQHARIQ
jgi:predicted nucleic acid-binding protein